MAFWIRLCRICSIRSASSSMTGEATGRIKIEINQFFPSLDLETIYRALKTALRSLGRVIRESSPASANASVRRSSTMRLTACSAQ